MKLRSLNETEIDVWPAFTDFLTSVLFIVVLFVFGILFSNIFRVLLAENDAYRAMQERQIRVRNELIRISGVEVPQADGNLQRIILRVDEGGTGGVLFERGQAQLQEPGKRLLDQIFNVLKKNGDAYDTIQVEGHTDDRPIQTFQYPSNWELSAARAGAVVNYILSKPDQLQPWRFSANGRAEFKPYGSRETEIDIQKIKISNKSESQAQRNRRIEVILTYKVAGAPKGDTRR